MVNKTAGHTIQEVNEFECDIALLVPIWVRIEEVK